MRQREAADRDLVLAWHIEYVRVRTANEKRMPDLPTLLNRRKKARRQTPEEQRAVLYQLSGQYGIPLRTKTP